jgi:hypothetical protein
MSRIPFFAVTVPAAQGRDSQSEPSTPPPSPTEVKADFLSLISKLFDKPKPGATDLQTPAETKPAPADPELVEETKTASVETLPTVPPDKTKKKIAADDTLSPAITATIMAMQAPPVLPPVEKRLVPAREEAALKIVPDQAERPVLAAASQSAATSTPPAAPAPVPPGKPEKPEPVFAKAELPATPAASPDTSPPKLPAAVELPLTPVMPLDGTSDALSKNRMKFVAEKKEIAGGATQKVPTVTSSKADAATVITTSAIDPVAAPGQKNGWSQAFVVLDWPNKQTEWTVPVAGGTTAAALPLDRPSVQVERVAQMVSDQAMTFRQTGASNLAVSLKVDAHTEIFLQLTTHDGQIQASLRYERGSGAGLDSHWDELQQSLARQNVQLLPREDKVQPTGASLSNFDQSSSNPQRQARDLRQELPETVTVKPISAATKTKTQTVSRQGWESWA